MMKKRFLPAVMALALLLSLLPVSALASEGGGSASSTATVSVDKASFGPGTEFSGVTGIRFERYTTGSGAELETTPVAEGQADSISVPAGATVYFSVIYADGLTNPMAAFDSWVLSGVETDGPVTTQYAKVVESDTVISCTGLTSWSVDGETLTISGNGATPSLEGNFNAPWSAAEGFWAKGTPASWNCKNTSISAVVIGEGITMLGNSSFNSYVSLKSVSLPATLTSMEGWIFHGCTALEEVALPDGLTSMGQQVFANCSALKRAVLPESLTEIGTRTFYQCTALTSVVLPADLKSIPDYTFYHCAALGELTLPAGITSIGVSAFDGCAGLENVWIPDSVTSVGKNAFANCTDLTSITLPAQITVIPEGAFQGCTALASVRLEGDVTAIGNRAFAACTALKQIELPDSLTTIEDYAFHQSGLERVAIPSRVTAIPNGAFSACSALRGVLFQGEITEQISGFDSASEPLIFYYMADEPDGEPDIFKAYRGAKTVAYTNGGHFAAGTVFESSILAEPVKDGYRFDGWYTDEDCTTPAAKNSDGNVEILKKDVGNL